MIEQNHQQRYADAQYYNGASNQMTFNGASNQMTFNGMSNQMAVSDMDGRLPAFDLDVEETVLGELMLESEAFLKVNGFLKPESFYDLANREIFKAIQELKDENRPIDMLTVTDQLRKNGTLEKAGGPVRITELTTRVYSAANIQDHARIINDMFISRCLAEYATKLQAKTFDPFANSAELLNEAENMLMEISNKRMEDANTHISKSLDKNFDRLGGISGDENANLRIKSGLTDLDRMTSGWQSSQLIVIGARPAMGKTALALSMARHIAVDNNIPVAIFTMEMDAEELNDRLLANMADVDCKKITENDVSDDERRRIDRAAALLYASPIYYNESKELTIEQLKYSARRFVRENGVKVIMIDYLQLLDIAGMNKTVNRELVVSKVARGLKALAGELKIPIIALAQLNRNLQGRPDKRPVSSDLRESDVIEQSADVVCLLHRPEVYQHSGDYNIAEDIRGKAELIIAKNRKGETGDIKLRFVKQFTRFEDWEYRYLGGEFNPPER